MRFRAIHLIRYGCFTNHSLDFGDVPGQLQIVYGANESGKSTTLRAIGDLLYGFAQLSRDAFLHDMTALRVGASFVADDGRTFDAYRRKGKIKTLLDAHEKPLAADPIASLLGAADRRSFERLLGLDHDRLRRGGEDLLKGGGSVALGLFQAGAGVASVRQVLDRLEEEADSLFRPKGSSQRINLSLKQLAEERSKTRQASLSSESYHRLAGELADVEKELTALGAEIARLEAKRQHRERVRANLGPIALRSKLQKEFDDLRDTPNLASDCTLVRQRAEERLHRASAKREQSVSRAKELSKRRDEQPVEMGILAATTRIKRIEKLLTSVAGAVDDLPRREAAAETLRSNVEDLLRNARLDVAVDVAEQHLPPTPQVQLIRRLAEERETLVARHDELAGQIQELNLEIQAKTQQFDEIPECKDPQLLERAVQTVLKLGPIEENLRRVRRDKEQLEAQVELALEGLPKWKGTVAELEALPVPLDATIVRFGNELRLMHASVDTTRKRLAEAREATQSARQELDRIQQGGDVPTSTVVADARKRREYGWKLVRCAYVDATEDVAAEAAAFDNERRLPDAYEVAVRNADELADRRQVETARVAHFEHASQKMRDCLVDEAHRADQLVEAERALSDQSRDWSSHWELCAIQPLSPEEMRDWLQCRNQVLERARRVAELANQERDEKAKLADARRVLVGAIVEVGGAMPADATLEQLVAIAEVAARTSRSALERRAGLADSLLQLGAKRNAIAARIETGELRITEWTKKWGIALAEIQRDAGCHPVEIHALLDTYDSLRVELTRWKDINSRVHRMREDRDNLSRALDEVAPEFAPEASSLPRLEAATELVAKLEEAGKAKNKRDHIEQELVGANRDIEEASRECDDATAELDSLCVVARCESADQLEGIEARAARKRQVDEDLREVDKQLLQTGSGLSVAELVAESEGGDADGLSAEILQIARELDSHRETEKSLVERRAGLRVEQTTMTGADEAAHGAQRAEGLIAGLCESVERWEVLKVSSELLRRGVERYRARNQGPLVGRASELFRALTLGHYDRLSVDYGERDEPVLLGVRPEGREVRVEGMSDGTRDQLYLALCLAVLEQFQSRGETLPVIADDLLIHFDDERSSAALEALCALAQKAQVLYFTHHRTVVELARKRLERGRFAIQELPG